MKNLIYLGVNAGQTFSRYVYGGDYDMYYGFEANPELAARLTDRYKDDNRVVIVHGAVGDSEEELEFYIYETNQGPVASSLGKASREFIEKQKHNSMKHIGTVKVPGINLNNYLKEHNVDEIDTYISDIQGMDYCVLETLKNDYIDTKKIKTIIVETQCDYTDNNAYNIKHTNKASSFHNILDEHYNLVNAQAGNFNEGDPNKWWHRDLTFKLK